jgi:1-acyl-sn-glycerol-3-phosphate acyltransferase
MVATAPAAEQEAPAAEQEAPAIDAKPLPTAAPKKSAPKKAAARAAEPEDTRMRAFTHCSYDDYRDHAMADYPRTSKIAGGIIVGACLIGTKLLWPWTFEDGEKLWRKPAPGEPGRVIIMNHVSMMEPVALYVSLYTHGLRPRFVYKSEFDQVTPLFSWMLSRVGAIPVERGTADLKCIRRCEKALKRGEFVCIYPEGTRIRTDDQPVEIHGGFALIAQLAKATVQPTAVVGARDITPQGTHLKRLFWRVHLKAGDPISFDEIEAKGRKAKAQAMEKRAMDAVYALYDELRRRFPHKH